MLNIRRSSVCLVLLAVSGCADLQPGTQSSWALQWPFKAVAPGGRLNDRSSIQHSAMGHVGGAYARFNFDWQLSGDREVMPLQVFDDGASMWLQFAPEGAWPAVFEVTSEGWRPLAHRSQGHYMVIDAVHDHLALRGGHLHGEVRKKRATPSNGHSSAGTLSGDAVPVTAPAAAAPPVAVSPAVISAAGVSPGAPTPIAEVVPSDTAAASAAGSVVPLPSIVPGLSDMAPGFLGAPVGRYSVSPADITMRQALERWARTAGWAFSAEHWDVDVDIPLVGEAAFEADFKSAVRDLLAATEMGDRPLQPCFYSNQVLRVVPYAQPCDRRVSMGAAQ